MLHILELLRRFQTSCSFSSGVPELENFDSASSLGQLGSKRGVVSGEAGALRGGVSQIFPDEGRSSKAQRD